jgi:tetratricopeptide (TPR) repeat protein
MLGHFDQARQAAARSVAILEELGHRPQAEASRGEAIGHVEVWAGDLVAAERAVRRSCEALQAMGETGIFSTQAADLAVILCQQGRFDEAEEFIELSRTTAAADDVLSQVRWRVAQARVLTSRGHVEEAVDLAGEAVAFIAPTDAIFVKGDTHEELALALVEAGKREEAVEALEQSLALHEQKGNVVSAGHVRQKLADLR